MNQTNMSTYFSNGNLIISGEYFVLLGAKALAVPLKFGQSLHVEYVDDHQNLIYWNARELGNSWFNATFYSPDFHIKDTSNTPKAEWLQQVFKTLETMKPGLFLHNLSFKFESDIQFNTKWGWGSSSTLLLNLASWAGINPFELNKQVTFGSGYDIAVSGSSTPILFQNKPLSALPVTFNPIFKNNIYFIFLGKKQNTSDSIQMHLKSIHENTALIPIITELSEKIATTNWPRIAHRAHRAHPEHS